MMEFDDVCVVAGGLSAHRINLDKLPGYVIAVNDAAVHLGNTPDCIVSMDRLWAENRYDWLLEQKVETWLRRSATKNLDLTRVSGFNLRIFDCDHTTTEFAESRLDSPTLNGTNSGSCALNRAYQMRPKRIWMIGFDMREGPKGQKHWYAPYDWTTKGGKAKKGLTPPVGNLIQWAQQFAPCYRMCVKAGIDIVNVSDWTRVTAIPIWSSAKFHDWLSRQ